MIHEYTLFTSCLSALEFWVSQKRMHENANSLSGGPTVLIVRGAACGPSDCSTVAN